MLTVLFLRKKKLQSKRIYKPDEYFISKITLNIQKPFSQVLKFAIVTLSHIKIKGNKYRSVWHIHVVSLIDI